MPSISLGLNQWDLLYANRIAAPLTSKLRLETASQSSAVTGELSAMEVDGSTKVGVGSGGEVEVVRKSNG